MKENEHIDRSSISIEVKSSKNQTDIKSTSFPHFVMGPLVFILLP